MFDKGGEAVQRSTREGRPFDKSGGHSTRVEAVQQEWRPFDVQQGRGGCSTFNKRGGHSTFDKGGEAIQCLTREGRPFDV